MHLRLKFRDLFGQACDSARSRQVFKVRSLVPLRCCVVFAFRVDSSLFEFPTLAGDLFVMSLNAFDVGEELLRLFFEFWTLSLGDCWSFECNHKIMEFWLGHLLITEKNSDSSCSA